MHSSMLLSQRSLLIFVVYRLNTLDHGYRKVLRVGLLQAGSSVFGFGMIGRCVRNVWIIIWILRLSLLLVPA